MFFFVSWASYQICEIADCAWAGNAGNVFLAVSDPGMHHGTWVAHVPWGMSGSLTRGGGENKTFPAFPAYAQPTILHIWQEVQILWMWVRVEFLKQAC